MQSAHNHITEWDTGRSHTYIHTYIHTSVYTVTHNGCVCVCVGCPVDLLQYVGARSVTVPSEFVSPPFTTNHNWINFVVGLTILFTNSFDTIDISYDILIDYAESEQAVEPESCSGEAETIGGGEED